MDLTGTATLSAPPSLVFAVVNDLLTYRDWLGIVRNVRPDGDGWQVDVGAKLGPFCRTKRVRMVRAETQAASLVRFERDERDGRQHSPWILTAELAAVDAGTQLRMHLHYGGKLWLPLLEPVLRDEIRRAGDRLDRLLAR